MGPGPWDPRALFYFPGGILRVASVPFRSVPIRSVPFRSGVGCAHVPMTFTGHFKHRGVPYRTPYEATASALEDVTQHAGHKAALLFFRARRLPFSLLAVRRRAATGHRATTRRTRACGTRQQRLTASDHRIVASTLPTHRRSQARGWLASRVVRFGRWLCNGRSDSVPIVPRNSVPFVPFR